MPKKTSQRSLKATGKRLAQARDTMFAAMTSRKPSPHIQEQLRGKPLTFGYYFERGKKQSRKK